MLFNNRKDNGREIRRMSKGGSQFGVWAKDRLGESFAAYRRDGGWALNRENSTVLSIPLEKAENGNLEIRTSYLCGLNLDF